METRIPVESSHDRVMEAVRRYRPMSIGCQMVVLIFMAGMNLLITITGEVRHAPAPSLYLSCSLLVAIFFVAMNAMRTQRQLAAVVKLVTQNFEQS